MYFCVQFWCSNRQRRKEAIKYFEAELRHLIYLHDELKRKRENAELKQLLQAKEEECWKVHAEFKELENNYTNLKTATTLMGLVR